MDDDVGFTFFLNLSYKQHMKDYPNDQITFHDFSSICLNNWESLEEEAKKKIIEIAKKEQDDEIKKEKKPVIKDGNPDSPIALDDEEDIIEYINVNKILDIAELLKKNFAKDYSHCKRPRSAYIYFVKAARIDIKNHIKNSKENFVEISKAISSKWNELKVSQRQIFEDLAALDKRFNSFKTQQALKKKVDANRKPLFLKARAEAREQCASTSNLSPTSMARSSALLASRRARTTTTKRKVKRKKTKKRKTTKTRTVSKVKRENFSIKKERKPSIKAERTIKKEIKVKREF